MDDDKDLGKTPAVVKRMLKNHDLAADAEADNRKRGLAALKFRRGGKEQWDTTLYASRIDDNRPTESYNQIPQFVHQVTNDMRMNMAQTRFVPGNEGSKEVAEKFEDLARNIQSATEAEVAYDAAADSQVTIGWGYWRYLTAYESDKSFDQVIKVCWVPNAFTVYDDPYATQQDRLDRKFLIQVCDEQVDDFNDIYDKDYSSIDLASIGDNAPNWATDTTVRVAEYWEVTETTSMLYRNKKSGEVTDKKPKDLSNWDSREVSTPKVMWYKNTALEVLEEREWSGKYIPYVFVAGEQINIDGQWTLSGLVENMMAPQKQYNYWTNAATEMVALAPKAPFIMDPRQIEGYEKIWDKANVKNYPYLPAKMMIEGQVLPAPQRANNSADIGSMLALVQQAQQNFYTTTGIYPASLGQQSNEKSGKAIIARQKEGDVSTFHFSDNISRALRAGGRILEDLIKKIYDAPRTVYGTKEDKTHYAMKINQRFTDDDGQTKEYNMTEGDYDVMVTTGPSFTTKRQESQEFYQTIAQAYPPLMQLAGDLVIGSSDMAGADKIAERLKPPGVSDEGAMKNVPADIQMQMQQQEQALQQQQQIIEQGAQELQRLQSEVENKQAENELKAMDINSKVEIERMKGEIEQQKLALDQEKLRLEVIKAQQPQQTQTQGSNRSTPDAQPASRNILQAQILDLDALEAKSQQEAFERENAAAMAAESEAQERALEAEKEAQSSQERAVLMQQLSGIQESVNNLAVAVATPKQVIRDPKTGLIAGVVSSTVQ